jgi:hypothetical protein
VGWRSTAAILGVCVLVAASGCGGDDSSNSSDRDSSTHIGALFIHAAPSAMLDPAKGTLTMRGAAPELTVFTDRPERRAGHIPFDSVAGRWGQLFSNDPPNAAVVHLVPEEGDPPIVELTQAPRRRGHDVVYPVRVVSSAGLKSGDSLLEDVSLLIDPGTLPRSGILDQVLGLIPAGCLPAPDGGCASNGPDELSPPQN